MEMSGIQNKTRAKSEKKNRERLGLEGREREFRKQLLTWFKRRARDLPWRKQRNPYTVLVSEFMLQQTRVETVIPYFEAWMKRFPDFEALASASEVDVLHAWQGLGYYSRARNLHRASRVVMERFPGGLPPEVEKIRLLPGVGPYTAAAVAAFAFDRPEPVIDGNVARVLSRLMNYRERVDLPEGIRYLETISRSLQPRNRGGAKLNEGLMELGATVCLPGSPDCRNCPVRPFCFAEQPELLPVKKARPSILELEENCGWLVRNGSLVLQKQTGRRWNGLWKLPLLRVGGIAGAVLAKTSYPFTRHRIQLTVYRIDSRNSLGGEDLEWIRISELDDVAMTAPHRRVVKQLLKEA